jgi:propanol-preferring alcohol dehydrogenase
VVLGHEVVGRIVVKGDNVSKLNKDDRIGVGWFYSSCGNCEYCLGGSENLCVDFKATGRDADGGYAEFMTVPEDSAYVIPEVFSDSEAAPLLCAGGVGYRSLMLTNINDGDALGLTGFGASGHIVLQLAKHKYPNSKIYVFARSEEQRELALNLGASWAGDTKDEPPAKLHSIIDTTPVWKPIVEALKNLKSGGRLVINAIRKEDLDKEYLLNLSYQKHLWLEKEIKTVANVTRNDITEFLHLASEIPIKPEVTEYNLVDANKALFELKSGKILGAKVLRI